MSTIEETLVQTASPAIEEFATELTPPQDELGETLGMTAGIAAARAPSGVQSPAAPRNLGAILHIPISLKVVLGSASMPVADLFKLGRGAIVPLDRKVGEPVDIVVNGHVIARGEVVVLNDGSRFGISLTEIVSA